MKLHVCVRAQMINHNRVSYFIFMIGQTLQTVCYLISLESLWSY